MACSTAGLRNFFLRQFCRRLHFRCPTCSEALLPRPNSIGKPASELACAQGHTVSVAAEGHVHLLPTGRKPRKATTAQGDSDASVRARRSFFDAGGYAAPVRAVAAETLRALAAQPRAGGERNVLDAGCGEGAYLRALEEASAAATALPHMQLWGTDISKLAVRLGARRQRAANFAVSRSSRLPFGDGTLDVVLSCFAPVDWAELTRVLRPGGALLVVQGGPEHLMGLKALVYDAAGLAFKAAQAQLGRAPTPPTPPTPSRTPSRTPTVGLGDGSLLPLLSRPRFRLERQVRLRTVERFEGAAAASLLPMTPFYWKATREKQRDIGIRASSEGIETAVDFECFTYRSACDDGGERTMSRAEG